ncbi:MAG TPA: transaldolase family protein, partial [Bryobacteraceae bacterium]|nr:transaldolase family protein [Bryobacteraceae bacterium]
MNDTYLNWVIENTRTRWWHDSADSAELDLGLQRGAVGVTTNPFLTNLAVRRNRAMWSPAVDEVLARNLPPEPKAEALMNIAVTRAAEKLRPEYDRTRGASGFVCAQVNPLRAGNRDCMYAMAKRFHAWAPNIAV